MSELKIQEVTNIIRDAGGKVVGRTRLQKIAYLLYATGLDDNFRFAYKHYGPFSEQLASSAEVGALLGELNERQSPTSWGGTYSTYSLDEADRRDADSPRCVLASKASEADSIVLELAATAVFLMIDGYGDPWEETAQRKPEKATQARLTAAKDLLSSMSSINVPKPIPQALFS
ncbi:MULTISPECIES: hypothetical protein [unclassified Phaeobacter]|uniref:hypothetical protein n=1 Tax=unclassified Phaeobacter TaxID=2621772 RepID=UPI003A865C38